MGECPISGDWCIFCDFCEEGRECPKYVKVSDGERVEQ